jgi:dinuclear metal center YbgI/SA1388 family protein
MAVALSTLVEEADRYLGSAKIADYCPNGLQVEGRPQVMRIVSGVTASQALLDAAVEAQADLVLVHHGYFWKGENPCITGMKQRRLKTLLKHDISLLAYHLPLDLHAEVGNNVQLARQLDITVEGPLDPADLKIVGLVGSLAEPLSPRDFAHRVQSVLGREPLLIEGSEMIRRVGWCTGGGPRKRHQLYRRRPSRHRALRCAGVGRIPGAAFRPGAFVHRLSQPDLTHTTLPHLGGFGRPSPPNLGAYPYTVSI